jgi:hypothetical protein
VTATDRPRHVYLALGAVGLVALAALAVLAHLVPVPRFFLDELFYSEAAVNHAEGRGLEFRGEAWEYGAAYPLVLSALVRLTSSQETTYELAKLANVAFFTAAAVPVYLLARQVLRPWPSVVVVALTLAIPSTTYVSVVMTESLAFLASSVAILGIALAVRSTRVLVHAFAIGAILLASAVRTQFLVLLVAYVGALALTAWISPDLRLRLRSRPVALAPALLVLVLAAARIVVALVRGEGLDDLVGAYGVLVRSYDPLDVGVSLARQVGDLTLFLAAVPVVVAPAVAVMWWAGARRGRDGDAAALATLVAVSVSMLTVVAAFSSTEFALGLLHDRNFFYVVPLWLVVLVAWVTGGMPRSLPTIAIGAALALVGLAALPFDWLEREEWAAQFEATATELPGQVAQVLPGGALPVVVLAGGVVAVAAVALARRPVGWILVGVVAAVLLANGASAWRSAFPEPRSNAAGPRGSRDWVDSHADGADASVLFVSGACERTYDRNAVLQTLFFNRRAETALGIGPGEGVAQPIPATVRPDGRIVAVDGTPLTDTLVVTQPDVALVGRRLASGSRADLVLWRITPPLRAARARSDAELTACATG